MSRARAHVSRCERAACAERPRCSAGCQIPYVTNWHKMQRFGDRVRARLATACAAARRSHRRARASSRGAEARIHSNRPRGFEPAAVDPRPGLDGRQGRTTRGRCAAPRRPRANASAKRELEPASRSGIERELPPPMSADSEQMASLSTRPPAGSATFSAELCSSAARRCGWQCAHVHARPRKITAARAARPERDGSGHNCEARQTS